MKNNAIFTIFKKEIIRFFKDRRTLVALLLPGVLIYALYSIMGDAMTSTLMPDEDYKPSVVVANLPDSLATAFVDSEMFVVSEIEKGSDYEKDIAASKEQITESQKDVLVIFPENFEKDIMTYQPATGMSAPNVEIYYNSSESDSTAAYQTLNAILDQYESAMANKFDVNRPADENATYDLAREEDITAMMFSMLMPMLLIMLLFSGCMAVAPESIAGEKERGTVATLLITPTKRSHIAIGKILALSVMALISGASSTIGVVLSLPKLMGDTVTVSGSVYSVTDYLMLGVVILSTVLLLITVISIVSAFAKTVKEASSYVTPLMVLSMLVGLSGMLGSAAIEPWFYCIPLYNSVQSMISIFSFNANTLNIAITIAVNLACSAAGVFVLTRMFNSERIMFNK